MQPYQEASQEIRRQGEMPIKALKTLGGAAGTFASLGAGASIAKRVWPFLSSYISEDLFAKGLSKIDPRFGQFIKLAKEHGKSVDEIKDFVKEKMSEEENPSKKAEVEEENIIQQYSPKLFDLISKTFNSGRTIDEVEGIARSPEHKFDKTIKNMEDSLGMTFYDIVRSVFGGPKRGQKNESPKINQNTPQKSSASLNKSNVLSDDDLLSAFDKLLKM